MRILWVSQWFPPDLGALPARLTEMAREWIAEGNEITVVTAFPHHPLGVIPDAYRGRWVVEERREGVRVIRCRLWALPNRKMWQRTLCQVSFAVTSVLLALTKPRRPDVVIVSSPPFFTVPAGWAFSRYHRAPLVFEVRDLWPDVFVASGVLSEGLLFRALRKVEMAFYRAARRVVVVTRSFRGDLLSRGVAEEKISVVPNGADLEFFAPRPPSAELRRRLGGEEKFLATYVGTHGILQGLEQILDAAEELREDPAFSFAFVGEGARRDALAQDAARRGLDRVIFQPALPRETMPDVYASSDACIVCLRPLPIFRKFVPSKIFEILACGRPLIAAVEGEAAEIVRAAGGIVVPPGDGNAIAAALRRLASSRSTTEEAGEPAGRRYVRQNFDRRRLAAEYLETLRAAVAGNPTPGPLSGP
jgi:glycosyltransferase involved in cell wall biosynthesis